MLTYTFKLFDFQSLGISDYLIIWFLIFRISDYLMKINPETLHTKFNIYVLIIFLIIILRYKKHDKNICIWKDLSSYVILSRLFWIFNIPTNIIVIMVNAVLIVTITNMHVLINDPFYFKILCSTLSPFNVQKATTRME